MTTQTVNNRVSNYNNSIQPVSTKCLRNLRGGKMLLPQKTLNAEKYFGFQK